MELYFRLKRFIQLSPQLSRHTPVAAARQVEDPANTRLASGIPPKPVATTTKG